MPSRAYRGGTRTASRVSFSVIAAVFLLLSTSLAVGVAHQFHQLSPALKVSAKPKYLVVLVLDGARRSYFDLASLPHLAALRSQGTEYDRAWDAILESETPAGHATLSTGSTPARDGLLGFNWITDSNTAMHVFNPDVVRAGGIEKVMQAAGAPTIASVFKAHYPQAKVVALSGHKYYAADPLGGPNADYIMYYSPDTTKRYVPTGIPGHMPPASILNDPSLIAASTTLPLGTEDTLTMNLAAATFKKVHQQITLINVPEFDWPLGHVDGGETSVARTLMTNFDRDLGRLEDIYRQAGVLDQTTFVITADHGMETLRYQIPDSVLDNAISAAGTTSLETTYSTAGYIWLQNGALDQVVANNIVKAHDRHINAVFYRVQNNNTATYVPAAGLSLPAGAEAADQYLLSSFQGGNAPDVVAFCMENATFVNSGAPGWKGNHGGGSWNSQQIPLIISGPGVAAGVLSHAPARLEDVAPTLMALFGLGTPQMQGTVLADALANPSSQQIGAQEALSAILNPVVDALKGQSDEEVAASASDPPTPTPTATVGPSPTSVATPGPTTITSGATATATASATATH